MQMTSNSLEQTVADMQVRIHELASLSGENLEGAMKELKKALMENPEACELMLPQDIGLMVAALRSITKSHAISEANKPKGRGAAKPKALSAAEMDAAFDEL